MKLNRIIRNLQYRVSLTPKMLVLTVLIGLVVWGIMDHILTKKLKEISDVQLYQILSEHFQEDRIRFDNYVDTFQYTLTLIISQKNFYEYVAKKIPAWKREAGPKYYSEIPPWLPDAAVMRHFIHIHYALLIDRKGGVREVYQSLPGPLPPSLSYPSERILHLSRHESFLTLIDGMPYLLTSGAVRNSRGEAIARLLIAAQLDDDFLIASQGLSGSQKIVGLLAGAESSIIASNKPDILAVGTTLDALKKRYLVVGKSFFDIGSSELTLEFASFISRLAFEKMNKDILAKERLLRSALSLLFILSFALIMIWITRRIKRLTQTITDISRETLHIRPPEVQKGDQILILANQFQYFANEIIESREQLKTQAEELLREKTVYLDNILHSSSLAIMATDLDFRIKYFNTIAEEFFGYKAKEVIGKTVMELNMGEKMRFPLFEKAVEKAHEDENPPFIDAVDTYDGIRFLESKVSGILDKDNRRVGFMLISHDITERRRAEESLLEKKQFLQTLIDTIPNPIFYKDIHGLYQGCNAAFEAFLGTHKSNIIGKTVYDIAPRELADKYHEMDMELFRKGGVQVYESSLRYADGALRDVIFNKATFTNADGSLSGLVGVILDITERKQSEQQSNQLAHQYKIERDYAQISALTDGLTGLANRRHFDESLSTEFYRVK
ncbi:MAG: PAS domain S-box protein, partial [Dissulfurispiraceae bacterium]